MGVPDRLCATRRLADHRNGLEVEGVEGLVGRPRGCWIPPPPAIRWGRCWGSARLSAKEVYAALDWLGREQPFIEAKLARRHLQDGALLLYDVTSTPAFAGAGSTSKDAAANWHSVATAATTVAIGRRLSSV
jgi:hypothetical protein